MFDWPRIPLLQVDALYLAHGLLWKAISRLRMQVAVANFLRIPWTRSYSTRRVIVFSRKMKGSINIRGGVLRSECEEVLLRN